MRTVRTPDEYFRDLPEFPYTPNYSDIDNGDGGRLRVAWIDEGPAAADPVLLLHREPFTHIVVANTGLPTGNIPMSEIWWQFRTAIQNLPTIDVGRFVASGCRRPVSDAPFPDDTYCAGPRAMPGLVPARARRPGRRQQVGMECVVGQ